MNEKEFREKLAEITKKARLQGFCLSMEEIKEVFGPLIENDEQMKHLLDYFKNQKISIGDQYEVEEYLSLADRNYLEDYLCGLDQVKELSNEEFSQIILSAIMKDDEAISVVLGQFLPKVVSLAKLYSGQGVLLEDLIGEGNLALYEGVTQLGCIDTDAELIEEAEGFLGKMMMDAMERLINGELSEKDTDEKVVEKVNRVADAARELSETMRRKITVEELTRNTDLTEEEIREAIHASGNQIEDIEDIKTKDTE